MNKKKQLAKNTLIIFMGKVCTQLISFLLLPLYTGCLSTKQYGLVDLIQTYVTLLVPLITLELEMSVFRWLIDTRGKDKDSKAVLSNNFFVLIFGLGIFSILYIIFTCFIHIPFRWLILIDIIVCTCSGNFLQVSRGFGRTLDYSISCIITGVTTIISNIILLVGFNFGADGMIISMAVANGMCSLYLFLRLKLYKYIDFSLVNKKLIKEMNKYSIPLIPNGVSWWIVNVSDRSIITFVLGNAANGLYAVSNRFPTIISSLLGVFNLSWSESAALHINAPDRDEFFSDITNTVTKLFSCLGAGMLACMPFVFPLLVNAKFNEAYDYIPFLVLGSVFNVLICIYSGVYIAKKLTKQVASTAVVGAIINILINIVFIKYIGLYAAALSTAISYFIMMLYRHFDLKKYVNIKFEKGVLINTIIIFVFSICLYYSHNLYLNIINLVVVCIYSYVMNRNILKDGKDLIFKKLKLKG